jgi:hypothetical protein
MSHCYASSPASWPVGRLSRTQKESRPEKLSRACHGRWDAYPATQQCCAQEWHEECERGVLLRSSCGLLPDGGRDMLVSKQQTGREQPERTPVKTPSPDPLWCMYMYRCARKLTRQLRCEHTASRPSHYKGVSCLLLSLPSRVCYSPQQRVVPSHGSLTASRRVPLVGDAAECGERFR